MQRLARLLALRTTLAEVSTAERLHADSRLGRIAAAVCSVRQGRSALNAQPIGEADRLSLTVAEDRLAADAITALADRMNLLAEECEARRAAERAACIEREQMQRLFEERRRAVRERLALAETRFLDDLASTRFAMRRRKADRSSIQPDLGR